MTPGHDGGAGHPIDAGDSRSDPGIPPSDEDRSEPGSPEKASDGGQPAPPPVVAWPAPGPAGGVDRRLLAVAIAFAVVAVGALWMLGSGSLDPHPAPRQLPPPIRDAVVLVPLGAFPVDQATAIATRESSDYGLPVTVALPVPIGPAATDAGRGQLVAERLVESIAAVHPESQARTLVIGLTTEDMYIAGIPEWRFAFGIRNRGGVAVVSSARMTGLLPGGEWDRLRKMVTRDIGFNCYGLPASDDPGDILYRNILGLQDLDRIGDHL